MTYAITTLDASTWEPFADLVERNNGIFGGCWCIGFHTDRGDPDLDNRTAKEQLVRTGRAHAALVLDEDGIARGWAQFGPKVDLKIKHRIEYEKQPPPTPGWRITCIFTDKTHRRQGVARAALEGALDQIAARGGGLVEAISEVTDGRVAQGRFLFSGTVELFEQYDFARLRQVGKHAWIVHRDLPPA
ncbi:GNAT family N-acetyltransferase [Microlunatus parietis]|uniref:GNAT superfamily N-acetyltransferase n=1 Tax=Microlunatus parietis TaxID=682979 RepID=A0A7Y9I5Y1_9ACTN|nr:GNAT family N-acetyltransferase [Microlunatus parietis]NYE70854.1 GNAT superfamily N-acetyltransferase [Microlunatus parietis]